MPFCHLIEKSRDCPGQHGAVHSHHSGIKPSHLLSRSADDGKAGKIHEDKEQVGKGRKYSEVGGNVFIY